MTLFFQNKINRIWCLTVVGLLLLNVWNIISNTPMVSDQHWAQKIFYVHVPSAWVGFLSYFVVMIAGALGWCAPRGRPCGGVVQGVPYNGGGDGGGRHGRHGRLGVGGAAATRRRQRRRVARAARRRRGGRRDRHGQWVTMRKRQWCMLQVACLRWRHIGRMVKIGPT